MMALLAHYKDGQTIAASDAEFLRAILPKHPDAKKKIGNGVKRFFIRPKLGSRCFWVEHNDGSVSSFGWRKCGFLNGSGHV